MTEKVEYREIVRLAPVLLRPQDLYDLEEIVRDSRVHKNDSYVISIEFGHVTQTAESVHALLELKRSPRYIDSFSITRTGWDRIDNEDVITRGVSITLRHNYGALHLHSIDEDWYQGKLRRLKLFFESRKPWYSLLNKLIPIYPAVGMVSLFYAAALIGMGRINLAIMPVILAVALFVMTIMVLKQKVFPFIRIYLSEKKSVKFGLAEVGVAAAVIAAAATIVQTIVVILTAN